jgi:hypothetical protein
MSGREMPACGERSARVACRVRGRCHMREASEIMEVALPWLAPHPDRADDDSHRGADPTSPRARGEVVSMASDEDHF